MGPLFLSSILHLTGLTAASPPFVVVAAAQLVIGTSVGCRFSGVAWSVILRTLTIGAGGAFIMFLVTALFAFGLYLATGNPLALLILALIPGGFPEMSLIALGMGFDPAFVVTHHGLRVLLVVAFALPIYRILERTGWFGATGRALPLTRPSIPHFPPAIRRRPARTTLSRDRSPAAEARANRPPPPRGSRCAGHRR